MGKVRSVGVAGGVVLMVIGAGCRPAPVKAPEVLTSAPAEATGISDRNWVVGSVETASGDFHAYVARPGSEALDLGTLGGPTSQATGVNDAGTVVGTSDQAGGTRRAFRWTAAVGLQALPPADQESAALAINARGLVVGTVGTRAAVWLPDGAEPVFLPVPGDGASGALDINDRNQIVGSVYLPGRAVPVLWEPGGAPGSWSPVELATAGTGTAFDLNDAGEVSGIEASGPGVAGAPVRWAPGSHTRTPLPTRGSSPLVMPMDINDAGTIVGYDGGAVAWVPRPGGGYDERTIDPPSPYLQMAINDRGVVALTLDRPEGPRAVRQPLAFAAP